MAARWTRAQRSRAGMGAAAFAAVIAAGALTGAQLKSDKQKEEAIKQFRETSPAEQIAMLQTRRSALVQQKASIEKKIDLFKEKVREREEGTRKG